jgi:cytochrome c556
MLRCTMFCLTFGLFAGLALMSGQPTQADDKLPSLDDVMKAFSGKGNVHKLLKKSVEAPKTDWADASKLVKKYSDTAELIGKYAKVKPEKGDAKGWAKLCEEFANQAKDLEKAVGAKDADASKAALAKLHDTCEKCHEDHR